MRICQVVGSLRRHLFIRHAHGTLEFLLGLFVVAEPVLASSDIVEQKRVRGFGLAGLHVLFERSGIVAVLEQFIAVIYGPRKKRYRQQTYTNQ